MDHRPLVVFFGTYDRATHPRVEVLAEGLGARGCHVVQINEPLGFDTARRVQLTSQPWRAPALAWRVVSSWVRLARRVRRFRRIEPQQPALVVVGYLGHFDVHLARRLFHAPIALDYLVGLGDTAKDRRLDGRRWLTRMLDTIDRRAVAAADLVIVDTDEQATMVPAGSRVITVPVGAPGAWFIDPRPADLPVRVVFFGLYTPLQGAVTIGRAIASLSHRADLCFTMVGTGQDRDATRQAAGPDARVEWIDWVDADRLPELVASHHVCLGIFGAGAKATRVVPNKVFQGAAAGCAIVTSDTPAQRRALGEAAVFVPPEQPAALAQALETLVDDDGTLRDLRRAAAERAHARFGPAATVEELIATLPALQVSP